MKRCPAWSLVAIVTIVAILRLPLESWTPASSRAFAQEPASTLTPEAVQTSIDKAVSYLKRTQNQDGSWTEYPGYAGGTNALCTLALLTAGVPKEDEHVKRALERLRSLPPERTYVVALQTMALCMAEPEKDIVTIRRNVRWLEEMQIKEGTNRGAWGYDAQNRRGDNSNSQYAMLGLHEAELAGVDVSERTWKLAEQYWLREQNSDGSWGYFSTPGREPAGTGSMTSAGVASMVIASGHLGSSGASIAGDRLNCCGKGGEDESAKSIERGLDWIGNHFAVYTNPGSAAGWLMYYLYGMERAGRMTSNRFFYRRDGSRYDWYRMGAEFLIRRQDSIDGFWKGDNHIEANPQIGTSFGLLFLAKGRRPILISKARFGQDDDWNRHRRDANNLTAYVESKWKRDFPAGLSWQVINLNEATVEDLLQTPVLYLSGSLTPHLHGEAKKLRDYIDRGGFIFAESSCPTSDGFDRGFRALVEEMFPEPEYRLKPVPPEHPIWAAEEPVHPKLRPNLWAVDYGCRTSVVYAAPPEADKGDLPSSLSCYWEVASGRNLKLPPRLQEQLAAAKSMGINILAYATNRELKTKDESYRTADVARPDDNFDRGKRYVAKLRHAGGCDAAPGALPSLLRAAAREFQARISTEQRQVAMTDPDLFNYDVVFMHGRHNFRLTEAERKQLRKYLERGTLIADAICANPDFAAALRREINQIFADQNVKLERIPADHPMFTREFGGYDLTQVSRREPKVRTDGAPLEARLRRGAPELEGIKLGDRYAVIFSPYDLSCALEKHDSLECEGYTRDDAQRIGLNLLLYSLFEF